MLTLTLNTTQTQGWPTEAPPPGDCPVNQHAWAHLSRHTIPAPQHTLTSCTPTQGPGLLQLACALLSLIVATT